MATKISVAEAKKNFSELMGRAHYKGERFVIERRGKPMVALIPVEELERLESAAETSKTERGNWPDGVAGAWADFEDLDEVVADIYRQRERSRDREVDLEKMISGDGQKPASDAKKPVLRSVGAWKEFENLDEVIREIYRQREMSEDREVNLED